MCTMLPQAVNLWWYFLPAIILVCGGQAGDIEPSIDIPQTTSNYRTSQQFKPTLPVSFRSIVSRAFQGSLGWIAPILPGELEG